MYTAHEAGHTVPPALLPAHMVKDQVSLRLCLFFHFVALQKKILASYAALKEETLNDASGSIWDSKDSAGANKSKGGGTQAKGGSGGDGPDGEAIERMCVELGRKLDDQNAMILQLQQSVGRR